MNKERRKELNKAISLLEEAKSKIAEANETVDTCKSEEEDAYDCLPESLQEGERGDMMQENIDSLDEAYSGLEDVLDTIYEAINSIQEAIDR